MITTVTRRSKVGYGYTSACERDERGNTVVCDTTKPYHVGTPRQVIAACDADRELQSYQSGGTYYSSAWFVRINGKWHRVVRDRAESVFDLFWPPKYVANAVELEVE